MKQPKDMGFTLLELIVVISIVAIAMTMGAPSYDGWATKKDLNNSYKKLLSELSNLRNEAFLRNTTMRMVVSSGGGYQMTAYAADTPVSACNAGSATWDEVLDAELALDDHFQITGSGVGSVCFYRDGTSSGGQYIFSQVDGGSDRGYVALEVTIATGFIDVAFE